MKICYCLRRRCGGHIYVLPMESQALTQIEYTFLHQTDPAIAHKGHYYVEPETTNIKIVTVEDEIERTKRALTKSIETVLKTNMHLSEQLEIKLKALLKLTAAKTVKRTFTIEWSRQFDETLSHCNIEHLLTTRDALSPPKFEVSDGDSKFITQTFKIVHGRQFRMDARLIKYCLNNLHCLDSKIKVTEIITRPTVNRTFTIEWPEYLGNWYISCDNVKHYLTTNDYASDILSVKEK